MWPWKRKTQEIEVVVPDEPVDYPSGVCVRTETGTFYIKGQFKYPIKTDRILNSWAFPTVIETSDIAVSKYLRGKPLGFRDGTVIYDFSSGRTFLISDNKRRHVVDPEALDRFGRDFKRDALWVSLEEANLHSDGKVID
jgi:hypothetical protein